MDSIRDNVMETEDEFRFIEIETKYEVTEKEMFPFKDLVEKLGYKKFKYVQGPDSFYALPETPEKFGRYRKAEDEKRAEWTVKEKLSKNSTIFRTEINWRVDNTPPEEIHRGALEMGFVYDTSIWKACHIYELADATLVYYSVRDEDGKMDHFVEIEIKEDLKIESEEAAMEIISKYETVLLPLGVKPQKRKRKSLREMYSRYLRQLKKESE